MRHVDAAACSRSFREVRRVTANNSTIRQNIWMLLFALECFEFLNFRGIERLTASSSTAPTRHLDATACSEALETREKSYSERQHAPKKHLDATCLQWSFREVRRVAASNSTNRRNIWMLLLAFEFQCRIQRVTARRSTLRPDIWMLLLAGELWRPPQMFNFGSHLVFRWSSKDKIITKYPRRILDFVIKSKVRRKNDSGAVWRGEHTLWGLNFFLVNSLLALSMLRLSW